MTLVRIIAAAGLLAALSATPAFATPLIDNSCQGISCNTDNSVNNNAEAEAKSTATSTATGGSATNTNAPVTTNNNTAKIEKDAIKIGIESELSVRSSNENEQAQKQRQHQSQSSYSESEVDDSGNSSVSISEYHPRQTPSAYAPAGQIGNNICRYQDGAGGSAPTFGFSMLLGLGDDGCEIRTNANTLLNTGNFYLSKGMTGMATMYFEASRRMLCSLDEISEQNSGAGSLCGAQASQNVAANTAAPKTTFSPMDPVDER